MAETNERGEGAGEEPRPGVEEDELQAEEDSAKAMDADVPQTPLASGADGEESS
jgi:hypothetical protein